MFTTSWTVCVALRVEVGLSSAGVTKREVYTGGVAVDSTVEQMHQLHNGVDAPAMLQHLDFHFKSAHDRMSHCAVVQGL